MIELRMTAGDFTQLRFAYSPVDEAIGSLHMLHSGQVHPLHRAGPSSPGAAAHARHHAAAGHRPATANLLTPPLDLGGPPTIEHRLKLVANWPPKLLRAELESVWQGLPMPDAARPVIADDPDRGPPGGGGPGCVLGAVIAPDWEHMCAVIDAEIAYWARQLVLGEISAVLNDLHPRLQLDHATIRLNKTGQQNYDLAGNGVLLVPEIFAGPHLLFDPGSLGLPVIGYALRGLAWSGRTTAPAHPAMTRSVPLWERAAPPSCAEHSSRLRPPTWPASLASAAPPSASTWPPSNAAAWSPHGVPVAASSTRGPRHWPLAFSQPPTPPPAPPCITPGSARSPAHPRGLPAQASIVAGRPRLSTDTFA